MSAEEWLNPKHSQEPAREVLFGEYTALLQSAERARLANRVIMIAIVLFYVFYGTTTKLGFGLLATGSLTVAFWYLQEFTLRNNLRRLQELIVEAYSRSVNQQEAGGRREILRRPAEENFGGEVQVSRVEDHDIWITAYVRWRQQRWVSAGTERIQNLEPVAWLGLLIIFVLVRTVRL